MDYYRVRANIDLNAIKENVDNIRGLIPSKTKLMVVVKADAYGHGAIEVAKAVEKDVDEFGVAIIEEAIELRQANIKKPILVLGFTAKEQIETAIENNVKLTVFKLETALYINKIGEKLNKKIKIHIKIDTGMNRIGYSLSGSSIDEIKEINKLKYIDIEGVFSHFSSADDKDKESSVLQLKKFTDFIKKLEGMGIQIPIKHFSNSAATIDISEASFNMVRCGIMVYGLYPSAYVNNKRINLRPAMTIKSHIIFIKEIDKNEGISYASTFVSDKKMKIGTIPVGYADGYSWALSNKSKVIINGQYANVLGRICMDQFMVDLTDIKDVAEGDEVILMGNDGNLIVNADELGELSSSFSYEFICHIGKRIPRVY